MTNPTTITAAPGLPFVDIVREFDAPAKAVFRAHIDPDLFARWTGPRSHPITIVEFDATVGGRWQYTFGGEGGEGMGFRGVFHTVEADSLLIQTFEFSGAPDVAGLTTIRFETIEGRTRLTARDLYPSVEVRDMVVASGMEHGVVEGYERLDELLPR